MRVNRWMSPYKFLFYCEQYELQGDPFFIVALHILNRGHAISLDRRVLKKNRRFRVGEPNKYG